jgi:uncharacterized protein YbjT (DUF2867 family)
MILVTGATGSNSTELLKLLSARAVPARAMVRSSDKAGAAAELPGIEIVAGDFDDESSLDHALHGIERAFLLTNSTELAEARQMRFVKAARRGGVRHIVKLSQFAADEASPVRFLRYHAAVERAIRETGVDYTFLSPNLFMQGLLGFTPTIKAEGRFYAAAGDAKVSLVDVRDIAAAAAAVLTSEGPCQQNLYAHRAGGAVSCRVGRQAVRRPGSNDHVRRHVTRGDARGAVPYTDASLAGRRPH